MTKEQTAPLKPDIPVLDKEGTLKRLQDDMEFLKILYGAFLEDLPKKLAALDEAVTGGETQMVQRTAHSLKGASATVGTPALREAALAMEIAAKEMDAEKVGTLHPELKTLAERTFREMTKALQGS
ncbi:MAG: Hpt domain-containing protein [Thermodesulfobacteriota bacterium]|nr:Hpt domain-containing protein [Thermodesulfobacteriota bacterium]